MKALHQGLIVLILALSGVCIYTVSRTNAPSPVKFLVGTLGVASAYAAGLYASDQDEED
jgi:hypothetical protein